MVLLFKFTCAALLIDAIYTVQIPFRLSNVKQIALNDLSEYNDFGSLQDAFPDNAKTLPHILYKSQHLPDTCGFMFETKSSPYIFWKISCVVSKNKQEYISCAYGSITILHDEEVRLELDLLYMIL